MTRLDVKSKICVYCKTIHNKPVTLIEVSLRVDDIIIISYEDRFGDEYKTIEVPLVCPNCLMITKFVQELKHQELE